MSSWNKARGLKPTEKPSDVDDDEEQLILLELLELEDPDEQPFEVSDDESKPDPPEEINKKNDSNLNHKFFPN